MNRPARKNAFGRVMIEQLNEVMDAVVRSNYRALIFRSLVERCFSAGADLKERAEMRQEDVATFVDELRSTFCRIEELSIPTIAAIDGVALGGGCELTLCCDLRYAGPDAKISLPETKLAILPAAGGSQRLPRLIGASRAKELIYTAAILSSDEAFAYGIVNRNCQTSAFDHAKSVAMKISEHGKS